MYLAVSTNELHQLRTVKKKLTFQRLVAVSHNQCVDVSQVVDMRGRSVDAARLLPSYFRWHEVL